MCCIYSGLGATYQYSSINVNTDQRLGIDDLGLLPLTFCEHSSAPSYPCPGALQTCFFGLRTSGPSAADLLIHKEGNPGVRSMANPMAKELVKMKETLKKPDELNKTPNADDEDVDEQISGIQTRYRCKRCEGKFGTWISSACGHLMCEKCIRHPKCVCDEDIKDRFPVKYADES